MPIIENGAKRKLESGGLGGVHLRTVNVAGIPGQYAHEKVVAAYERMIAVAKARAGFLSALDIG